MTEPFNLNKFSNQINNPDEDFTIIAFEELINHLNAVEEFDLSPESIKLSFLHPVIDRITDKTPDIANPVFRIVVLLAEKLPICTINDLINNIFEVVFSDECQVRTQTLSVFREILFNSVSYSPERQKEFVNVLVPKLECIIKQNQNVEILVFSLELLESVSEFLGFLYSDEYLGLIYKIIIEHAGNCTLDLLQSVASLTKIYMTIALPEQFQSMIDFLFKLGETNTCAYSIMASMTCYKPSIYGDYAQKLVTLFTEQISKEEEDIKQKLEEKPDTDIFYDTLYVPHITEYVSSLSALTKTFPDQFSEEVTDNFIYIAFQYLTYGSNSAGEAAEPEDDGFIMDGESDGDEDMKLDEVDDEVITGDDSWKIRKTAMAFATTLITCYTDKFFESLNYRDEECDYLSVVDTLLKDTDTGAQKDAFGFLQTVVRFYKEKLDKNVIFNWYLTLQTQLTSSKQSIAALVTDTISSVLAEYGEIPGETLLHILEALSPLLNSSTIPSALGFFMTIFKVTQGIVEAVEPIASTLTDIITSNKVSSSVPYLPTASQLFVYSKAIELNEAMKDSLGILGQAIISISTGEEQGDKVQAFEALGVFIVECNLPTVNDALRIIVEALENETALKPVCGAISLISASDVSDKLVPYANRICDKLCGLVGNVDSTLGLWTLRILLEKGILLPSQCDQAATNLMNIISTGDAKSKLLALNILQLIPNGATKALDHLKTALMSKLTDNVISETAILLNNCAEISIDDVRRTISTLITTTKASDVSLEISANIASVIGYPAGTHRELGKELLVPFEKSIVGHTSVSPFDLQCIGEIGTSFDLGSETELIDSIFGLVSHQDRLIFSAAAECIGLLAVGSIEVVLKRLLESASKDVDQNSSTWISAILSLTKRLSNLDGSQSKLGSSLQTISDFLVRHSDHTKPTERTIAQCFANLIKISATHLTHLISLSKTNELAAPVLFHGIAIFIENAAPEVVMANIDTIVSELDEKNPRTGEYILHCLKTALQVSGNAFPKLLKFVDQICNSVPFKEGFHITTEYYGAQVVKKDIAKQLRVNALDCLILVFKAAPEAVQVMRLISAVKSAIDDKEKEVKGKGCELLAEMAISTKIEEVMLEKLPLIKESFAKADEAIFDTSAPLPELEEVFFKLIVCLRLLTEKQRSNDIEQIYAKHKTVQRLIKIESDLSYSVNDSTSYAAILNAKSASYLLMEKFYPKASVIFTL